MVSKCRCYTFNMPLLLSIVVTIQTILLLIQPCDSLPRTPNLSTMDLHKRKQMQRGLLGRVLTFRPRNSNGAYIEMLKDQILQMEQQLRKSEMEAIQLRALLQTQLSSNRKSTVGTIRDQVKIEENMKKIINELTKQIQELKKTKAEMEEMLKLQQERADTAEELLKEEQANSQKLIQNSRIQMEEIKETIMKKASFQMQEMEKTHLTKFQKELAQVKIESEKAIEKERARSSVALERERKELEEEKRKGKEAVEKERVKMRKLVKALAEKEKRDLAREAKKNVTSKDHNERKENRRVGGISKSKSLITSTKKAPVRGKPKPS